jgi:hypothetical protein
MKILANTTQIRIERTQELVQQVHYTPRLCRLGQMSRHGRNSPRTGVTTPQFTSSTTDGKRTSKKLRQHLGHSPNRQPGTTQQRQQSPRNQKISSESHTTAASQTRNHQPIEPTDKATESAATNRARAAMSADNSSNPERESPIRRSEERRGRGESTQNDRRRLDRSTSRGFATERNEAGSKRRGLEKITLAPPAPICR